MDTRKPFARAGVTLPLLALSLAACQAPTADELVADAQSSAASLARDVSQAGTSQGSSSELQARGQAILSQLEESLAPLRVPVLEISARTPRMTSWVADRVQVEVPSRLQETQAILVGADVVSTALLELNVDSSDCVREPAITVAVNPEKISIYNVGTITATCTDANGVRVAKGVVFQKHGGAGNSVTTVAAAGADGSAVGAAPADVPMGTSCGDNGLQGAAADMTPTAQSVGSNGQSGSAGGRGGDVAFTLFQLTLTTNTQVSFEAPGGAGGRGQDGGKGGAGGVGQDGGDGSDGREACCYGTCDANGCNLQTVKPAGAGGVGGIGGIGGNGGNGGDGGKGGDGGMGGTVFALVEASVYPLFAVPTVQGGTPGTGGVSGASGAGGFGGRGGLGGAGGVSCTFTTGSRVSDGPNGTNGISGSSGATGSTGRPGSKGMSQIIPTTARVTP